MVMRCGGGEHYVEFSALHDVNFELYKKARFWASLGRNERLENLLLQLICGTLSPTSGHVKVQGSLLLRCWSWVLASTPIQVARKTFTSMLPIRA